MAKTKRVHVYETVACPAYPVKLIRDYVIALF